MLKVSRRLNVSENTLQNWLKAYRQGKVSEVGKNYREMSTAELELSQLRRELAKVKMERDILKKAAAYFAKESQESTR
ncbi:MAG TPA: transposase [Dissulfurispiraceae bacterium]|nr:transposase [Dissulfurispiraceae bacterium]